MLWCLWGHTEAIWMGGGGGEVFPKDPLAEIVWSNQMVMRGEIAFRHFFFQSSPTPPEINVPVLYLSTQCSRMRGWKSAMQLFALVPPSLCQQRGSPFFRLWWGILAGRWLAEEKGVWERLLEVIPQNSGGWWHHFGQKLLSRWQGGMNLSVLRFPLLSISLVSWCVYATSGVPWSSHCGPDFLY